MGDNPYLRGCEWVEADGCSDGVPLLKAYGNYDSHVSLPGFESGDVWTVCCRGRNLTEVDGAGFGSSWLFLNRGWNSHACFNCSYYDVSAGVFSSLVDFEFLVLGADKVLPDNFERGGWNSFVPVLSFMRGSSGPDFDSHVGQAWAGWNTLYARAGIPMLCGEKVEDPDDGFVSHGPACNDSITFDGHPVQSFCDNVSDCVALNESGVPECFSEGELFQIDDLFSPSALEVCSNNNTWCPENYVYDADIGLCYIEEAVCYENPCNELEKVNVGDTKQRLSWLLEKNTCSFYTHLGSKYSCCLDYKIGSNDALQTDQVVRVYPGGGRSPVCVDDSGEEVSCPPSS